MSTAGLVMQADRTLILCHAIRHLLDHPVPMSSPQYMHDTDAVSILQYAMDGFAPEGYDMVPEPQCLCEALAEKRCENCKRFMCLDCYRDHDCRGI